jgi:hypothetical protein
LSRLGKNEWGLTEGIRELARIPFGEWEKQQHER